MVEKATLPSIATTCPYCGVGCGVLASPDGAGGAKVVGDAAHPANEGRLCVKGTMLGETLDLDGRLLYPQINGRRASWDAAIARIAGEFSQAIREHGPDSVALYVSGQILTEDYYVANKLIKGFIGTGNIDTNSRLCMASSVAGHKRAFGGDVVPGVYEDLETADTIVLVGSNLAWCHPVLHQRIAAAKAARPDMRIVNVDPRVTATSEFADLQLSISPGADVALFNGLLSYLAQHDMGDQTYLDAHTNGAQDALKAAGPLDLAAIAARTGLAQEDVHAFYDLWARRERVVTIYSQGVNQAANGTDKVNAIINCHLYTGRIGLPGMGPFSVTGQPNAMGGREVGGLANMLAAHMAIENPKHRILTKAFWESPRIAQKPGLKAVDLFNAVESGRIKAIWVMATNPTVSAPQADAVRSALAQKDVFVAASDVLTRTDTTLEADVLLPATGWGEKDGTVTNSERRISRQRPFLAAPGEARHDWRAICDVARALGRSMGENWDEAFSFESPVEVFREHAALSGFQNEGDRAFDISAHAGIDSKEYEALTPFQWPAPALRAEQSVGEIRLFSKGGYPTQNKRANLLPVDQTPDEPTTAEFPFRLNTGRVRDQWHTMTRTGKSPRLARHIGEPYLELHPKDAEKLDISDAELAAIESPYGKMVARALITEKQRPGRVFAPMHWTAQTSSLGRVNALVGPKVDPISGQPQSKDTPVSVSKYAAAWYGFAVTQIDPDLSQAGYWAKGRAQNGWRIEMAGEQYPNDAEEFARQLLGADLAAPGAEMLQYVDGSKSIRRYAFFGPERLLGAFFMAPQPVAVARDWLVNAFDSPDVEGVEKLRYKLLAGRAGDSAADQGPTVCVCHGVGAKTVREVIGAGAKTLEAVGAACKAGTNCGSCRPEIQALLRDADDEAEAIAAE